MGFSREGVGYAYPGNVVDGSISTNEGRGFVTDIVKDMIGESIYNSTPYFRLVFPQQTPFEGYAMGETGAITLEATNLVDPLFSDNYDAATDTPGWHQPWRIRFNILNDRVITINAAPPLQLNDQGEASRYISAYLRREQDMVWDAQNGGGGYLVCPPVHTMTITEEESGVMGSNDERYGLHIEHLCDHGDGICINPQTGEETNQEVDWDFSGPPNGESNYFVDRTSYVEPGQEEAIPVNFRLTISDHGVALMLWDDNTDVRPDRFSFFCIQRPVNNVTGHILGVRHPLLDAPANEDEPDFSRFKPLFCVYAVNGGHHFDELSNLRDLYYQTPDSNVWAHDRNRFPQTTENPNDSGFHARGGHVRDVYQYKIQKDVEWRDRPRQRHTFSRFTVREADIPQPSDYKPCTVDTDDSNRIFNSREQIAISEDDKFIITFPNRITTQRHLYFEELDLIGYTSADVIAHGSDAAISVYGESVKRVYRAMRSNGEDQTGMRIMIQTEGIGITHDRQGNPYPE